MRVNQAKDFAERVGWTAIYFAAGALLAWIETDDPWSWHTFANGMLVAVLKVIIAQRVGTRGSGDAIPGGVIETHSNAGSVD